MEENDTLRSENAALKARVAELREVLLEMSAIVNSLCICARVQEADRIIFNDGEGTASYTRTIGDVLDIANSAIGEKEQSK